MDHSRFDGRNPGVAPEKGGELGHAGKTSHALRDEERRRSRLGREAGSHGQDERARTRRSEPAQRKARRERSPPDTNEAKTGDAGDRAASRELDDLAPLGAAGTRNAPGAEPDPPFEPVDSAEVDELPAEPRLSELQSADGIARIRREKGARDGAVECRELGPLPGDAEPGGAKPALGGREAVERAGERPVVSDEPARQDAREKHRSGGDP